MYEVVKVLEGGAELVVAGRLNERQAEYLREHFLVGCEPGESVRVQLEGNPQETAVRE